MAFPGIIACDRSDSEHAMTLANIVDRAYLSMDTSLPTEHSTHNQCWRSGLVHPWSRVSDITARVGPSCFLLLDERMAPNLGSDLSIVRRFSLGSEGNIPHVPPKEMTGRAGPVASAAAPAMWAARLILTTTTT
jgi:hypothetical protein